jgi:hypothetical protein
VLDMLRALHLTNTEVTEVLTYALEHGILDTAGNTLRVRS